MEQNVSEAALRQRLGRRLGLDPYYVVAERGPDGLRLESRSDANQGVGRRIMALGGALVAVAALVAISGLYAASAGAGFAAGALGAVVGGLLGAFGYQRIVGGYAVATTGNSIVADANAGVLRFTQTNRVARERSQTLPFTAIQTLRLRRRPLATGAIVKQMRSIVALELVAAGDNIWIVDSAADPEQLRPIAEGLSDVLNIAIADR